MEITTSIRSILDQKDPDIWSVKPEDTVYDAISLMAKKNIGALPVLQGNRLFGMVSERDYTRKVILLGRSSRRTAVEDIMTREIIVVKPRDSVQECMRLMTENRVRHLPVVEDGSLKGILSIGDVVNWIIGAQSVALEDLEHFLTGAYPG
jgi:CBS domain-containing protein